MNQVEEILSQLKDGDKLIYNIAANVIEQQQKRIDELVEENKRLKSYVERKLNRNLPTYEQLEAKLKELKDEIQKVWNEDGQNGEIQMKTPIAWHRILRLSEQLKTKQHDTTRNHK